MLLLLLLLLLPLSFVTAARTAVCMPETSSAEAL
jgi:hypothetical protein